MKKIKKIIVENVSFLTIALIVIGVLVSIMFLSFVLKDEDKTVINVISVLGSIASFFGLAIAIIQIVSLKEITELTRSIITETKSRLLLGISISEVGDSISLIHEIEMYIGNNNYEISRIRLIDLRGKLIQFKTSDDLKSIVKEEELTSIIDKLNLYMSTLYIYVYEYEQQEVVFDRTEFSIFLHKIATYLTDFKNKIKYQTV